MIIKSLSAQSRKNAAKLSLRQLADPDYTIYEELWDLCDDVFDGELKVKSRDDRYIYRPVSKSGNSKERKRAWEAYKMRGVMPDYAATTLEKMCGILSSRPPLIQFEGKAQRLEFLREFATPYHDGLDSLLDRVIRNILRSGRYCLLLEPDESDEIGFHINEYKCRKYLRARTVSNGGETYADMVLLDTSKIQYNAKVWRDVYYPQITLLALDSNGKYYQAKFGEIGAQIDGYNNGVALFHDNESYSIAMGRVFDMLEGFDIENPDPAKCTELVYPSKYGRTLERVPFVCINPGDLNFHNYWNPPLLKLCLQSIHILDADCTYKTALFMTGDPQPVITGAKKTDLQTGPDCPWFLPQGANYALVSPSGAGLAEQANSLDQMRQEATQMGVSLAGQQNLTNTAVGTMTLFRNAQTADLMRINQNAGKSIEQILRYAGMWIGMSPDEFSKDINFKPSNEFAEIKATAQECAAIAASRADLQMTPEEIRAFVEKNDLAPQRPWDEVKAELDEIKAENQESMLNSVGGAFGFQQKPEEEQNEEEQQPDNKQKENGGKEEK